MNLGFIGLGVMGRPMALNLMKHGHGMGVYARRAEAAAPLVAAGANRHATPAELAANAEVIFTMVTNSRDVEEVVLGGQGVIHGARRGSVFPLPLPRRAQEAADTQAREPIAVDQERDTP